MIRLTTTEAKQHLGLIIAPGTYKIGEILCCVSDRPIERNNRKLRVKP